MVQGRRREIGVGPFRLIGLAKAREIAKEWRTIARDGGDPKLHRDRQRAHGMSFEDAAKKAHAEIIVAKGGNGKHVAQWLTTLESYAFPAIGKRPVSLIDQADVIRVLRPIWLEKAETARRVRQRVRAVLEWARVNGHREALDATLGVESGLPKAERAVEHFAAVPWRDLPALMRRIEAAEGMGALALRFAILTAARSGEVRGATWAEIDFDAAVWTVPAARMKAGKEHRVPLSPAALEVLRAAKAQAVRPDDLAFPSTRPGKPLSDMTLSAVLKRLNVEATVHGFRSTFRDWTEEATAYPHEVKEAALAHIVKSKVERAYRRTDLFERRAEMMAAWAGYVSPA
jgi:integrase